MSAKASSGSIRKEALAAYLTEVSGRPVEVQQLRSLGGRDADDPKGLGYGVPFEVECLVEGRPCSFVVSRTRPVQGFGHDYAADRAWQAIYAHGAYSTFPSHVKSLDVGFVRPDGSLVSAGNAVEYFQLVEKAPGDLYWLDLDRLLAGTALTLDTERACALGRFLSRAHAEKREEPTLYHRRIRELVGHGECLMGILDSYPHPYALLPDGECEALERQAVAWRWKLRNRPYRLCRVHGDFHPWNILFKKGTELAVLDRSRGEWGEPADDVAALGINYLFFGLRKSGGWKVADPFRGLFDTFLSTYLDDSGDRELLDVLPPFLMFRALVIAHPRWYPTLTESTRRALLAFARAMARADAFDPEHLAAYLGDAA